jgi:hypothetical protein
MERAAATAMERAVRTGVSAADLTYHLERFRRVHAAELTAKTAPVSDGHSLFDKMGR